MSKELVAATVCFIDQPMHEQEHHRVWPYSKMASSNLAGKHAHIFIIYPYTSIFITTVTIVVHAQRWWKSKYSTQRQLLWCFILRHGVVLHPCVQAFRHCRGLNCLDFSRTIWVLAPVRMFGWDFSCAWIFLDLFKFFLSCSDFLKSRVENNEKSCCALWCFQVQL